MQNNFRRGGYIFVFLFSFLLLWVVSDGILNRSIISNIIYNAWKYLLLRLHFLYKKWQANLFRSHNSSETMIQQYLHQTLGSYGDVGDVKPFLDALLKGFLLLLLDNVEKEPTDRFNILIRWNPFFLRERDYKKGREIMN